MTNWVDVLEENDSGSYMEVNGAPLFIGDEMEVNGTGEQTTDEEESECEHDDVELDERCCLTCGKDLTEDMCAEAEWNSER